MTMQTWRDEFYPKPADQCRPDEAVAHSLQKWRGLLPENLTRHNVYSLTPFAVLPGMNEAEGGAESLVIGGVSCALCHVHLPRDEVRETCRRCPLAQVRDGWPCDTKINAAEERSPWAMWIVRHDPKPMIGWLERAQAWEAEENRKATEAGAAIKVWAVKTDPAEPAP